MLPVHDKLAVVGLKKFNCVSGASAMHDRGKMCVLLFLFPYPTLQDGQSCEGGVCYPEVSLPNKKTVPISKVPDMSTPSFLCHVHLISPTFTNGLPSGFEKVSTSFVACVKCYKF